MTETLSIIGFLAVCAALLTFFCDDLLDGLARRCTARRIARTAYWEAYRRAMNRDEVEQLRATVMD